MALKRSTKTVFAPITNVVVVEGGRREFRYFEQAVLNRKDPGAWSTIPAGGGDPTALMLAMSEALRGADRVFVVSDGDRYPPACSEAEAESWARLQVACDESEGRIVNIVSHPCVEAWFLWHFTFDLPKIAAPVSGKTTKRCESFKALLREFCPQLDKRPVEDWEMLLPQLSLACRRGRDAREGKSIRPPVWSDVDLLMRELGLD